MAQLQLVKAVHQHPHQRETWTKLGQHLAKHAHTVAMAHQAELCASSGSVLAPFSGSGLNLSDMESSWLLARTKVSSPLFILFVCF